MENVKVSVIVPVYKIEESLLRRCLDSLASQSEKNAEFIVVDDGSPDCCGDIIDEYAIKDSRFVPIHTENCGVSNARNVGLDHAVGKYVIFVDGDDYVEDLLCEYASTAMDKAGTDVLFFMHQTTIDKKDTITGDGTIEMMSVETLKRIMIGVVSQENPIEGVWAGPPWGKVYKRSIIEENGLRFVLGLKKSQDRVFVLDYLLHVGSAAIYKYVGYHYVINETSVCQRYNPEIESILLMAGEEFEKRKEFIPYKNEYNSAINTMYMIFFCECMLLDFFNHDNKNRFLYKINQMKNLLNIKMFKDGVKTGNLNAISRKRRLIVLAARHNMYLVAGLFSIVLFR